MPDVMCQFDDCHETDTPWVLSISWKGQRQENCRFCSPTHMRGWMLKYTGQTECGQKDRDARILAEAQTELLTAIESVLPFLPDRNDAKDYAATNEGRASSFQVAAIKLREVYGRTK